MLKSDYWHVCMHFLWTRRGLRLKAGTGRNLRVSAVSLTPARSGRMTAERPRSAPQSATLTRTATKSRLAEKRATFLTIRRS